MFNEERSRLSSGIGEESMPDGFVPWFKIMKSRSPALFELVEESLSDNDLGSAVAVFQRVTADNVKKVWH